MISLFDMSQKVSVVTGGTGHLGTAMCEGLAEAGSSLAICSTDQAKADKQAKAIMSRYDVTATGFELDLRNLDSIRHCVANIVNRMGRIDCLVNNAAFAQSEPIESMTVEAWNLGIDGSVSCHMFMMQTCLPYLVETQGNVINISSMYGMVSPNPSIYEGNSYGNPVNYGAGKAALLQLTKYASVHFASKGIRVNAISPGAFPSPAIQEQNPIFIGRLEGKIPLARIGKPEELKGAVVFLASSSANYVTGHNLVVDGGWTVW